MPTSRFSTWSIRPTPCLPPKALSLSISVTPSMRWPLSPFTGAPASDRLGVLLPRGIDHQLADQRPAERRSQGILALVKCPRHQRRKHKAIDEQVARVHRQGIHGAGLESLLPDALDV